MNWPAFPGPHNLCFEALPRSWQEAPHFGNALVGSMLYPVENTIRLQVFRGDVQDAEFHDLRAEGAFLVSARRCGGRTEWVRIRSLAGEPCRVRPGIPESFQVRGSRPHTVTEVTSGVFQIDLARGEDLIMVAQSDAEGDRRDILPGM